MSDYTRANSGGSTHFGDKDSLTSGDSDKVVVGAQFDTEFNAIVTAVATKYDSSDLATQAQAEGETLNTVLITPLRLANWADYNLGIIGDLQAISSDPGEDAVWAWDYSTSTSKAFTLGTSLTTSGASILVQLDASVAGDGLANSSGVLSVNVGNGLSIASDTVGITDVTAGAAQPVNVSSGTFTFDLSSITEIGAEGIAQAADGFLYNDAGTLKVMPYDQAGALVVAGTDSNANIPVTWANTIQSLYSESNRTYTIQTNATADFEAGSWIVFHNYGGANNVIQADTSVYLHSIYNETPSANTSDTLIGGGTAVLIYLGSDHWLLSGDITD